MRLFVLSLINKFHKVVYRLLKKVHNLNVSALTTIYGGTGLLSALIFTGMSTIALALLYLLHGFFDAGLTAVVLALFGVSLYLSIFPPPLKWKRRGILGIIFESANSWHALSKNRSLLIRLGLSFFASAVALTTTFYFIYNAIGASLSVSAVLIISSLGNIANLVPITPGSLGVFDIVTIKAPQMLGLDAARSLAATLVFRVILFSWALATGIPASLYLVRILGKKA